MTKESRYGDEAQFLQLNREGSMLRWDLSVFTLLTVAETWSDGSISEISCQLTKKLYQGPLFPWVTVRECNRETKRARMAAIRETMKTIRVDKS